MRATTMLAILCISIFILLICMLEQFADMDPKPTFNLVFLRSPGATQKIINPLDEKIFPANFKPSDNCLYPEQCPNPTTRLWGSAARSTSS